MRSPTDVELTGLHPVARAWLRPVIPMLPTLEATKDKPIGQFTVPELLSWAAVLGYVVSTIMVGEALALNVLRVAVRGR